MINKRNKTKSVLVTKSNTKLNDFIKSKPKTKPQLIICKQCGSRYSEVLKRCPECGLIYESPQELKNWKEI